MRHQLPAYSPLRGRSLLAAARPTRAGDADELRRRLANEYQAEEVLLCGSGTQALQLAIGANLKTHGARTLVALPAFNCFDLASAVVGAGVEACLYDIDPATLGPDLGSLRSALKNGANVIVVAPLFGIPLDWSAVEQLAAEHGATLIEDAAQGSGAFWQDRKVGSLGPVSVLSFGRGKGWTGGHGGAVLLRHGRANAADMRSGLSASRNSHVTAWLALAVQWALGRPSVYRVPASIPLLGLGETIYQDPQPPAQLAEQSIAVLLDTAPAVAREIALRKTHASFYLRSLTDAPGSTLISVPAGGEAGYLRFPLRVTGQLAGLGAGAAGRRLGIAASYPAVLDSIPQLKSRLKFRAPAPGAEQLVRELVTLPTHSLLQDEDLAGIVNLIRGASSEAGSSRHQA